VDSVLAQTYSDWELIIVDDGSTDTSGKIADRYAATDPRITVLHVSNGGLSYARNTGIDISTGQYICFLDSDDALHPQAIRIMTDAVTNTNADIVIAGMKRGEYPDFKPLNVCRNSIITSEQAIASSLYQDGVVLNSAWSKLYKKELFCKQRFTPGILYEDLDFFYRVCIECSKIAICVAPLYFYRNTPGSITNKWTDKRLDVLDVVDRIEAYMAEHHPALLAAARDRKLSANFNMFILATSNCRPEVAKGCWQVIRQYRWSSLTDRRVRIKNKAGILLSYLGPKIFAFLTCRQK